MKSRTAMWLTAACVAVTTMIAAPAHLAAHPTSTTTVSIVVTRERHVTVTFTANADSLITKLEDGAGRATPDAGATAAGRTAVLRTRAADMVRHLTLRTTSGDVALSTTTVHVDAAGMATVTLGGTIVNAAEAVTWQSTLVYGAYPVAVDVEGLPQVVQWVQGPETTQPVRLTAPTSVPLVMRGIALGFTHILPHGLDHILFVIGLALLSRRKRDLLRLVTTFTVAHSLTLALSLYGAVSLPPAVVEPLIALSVAYVGFEHLAASRMTRLRTAVVFGFGLLHGLGFAEALAALHLSRGDLAWMLVSFNLGVEAGQLAVLCGVIVTLAILGRHAMTRQWPVVRLTSAMVGMTGLVWTVERLL